MGCKYDRDYLDFLPAAAVQRNVEYIQTLYQRTDDEIEQWYIRRPGLYLNTQEMDGFVDGCAARLIEIYRTISVEQYQPAGSISILD